MDLVNGTYSIYILGDGKTFDPAASFTYEAGYTLGDVNNDGDVNALDAILILRAAVNLTVLSNIQEKVADMNGDGNVDALDAIKVLIEATK